MTMRDGSLDDWYEKVRTDATFNPRLISGSANDRLSGLEMLIARAAGASILDIGCHKGIIAFEFAKAGARLIHGLDHSRGCIEVARSLLAEFSQPNVFDVLDLRQGAPALRAWLAANGQTTYEIVLYLGIHHHLMRQMPKPDLEALVAELASRASHFFVVRTPEESIPALRSQLQREGFALKHFSRLSSEVGPLYLFAREDRRRRDVSGQRRPDDESTRTPLPGAQGLPDADAERQYADLHQQITAADVCFLSISKSGRTWVRYFLHHYFGAVSGHPFDMRPRGMPRTPYSPSICFSADFLDYYEFKPGAPRIVLGPEMRERALVLMVRDPRDVVISYFHFSKAFTPVPFNRHVASGSLDEFIESPIFGIERIAAFHLVELDFFESHPVPKHLLAYERLWSQPALGFAHLTKFPCGDGIALDCFAAALDAARFEAMQSFEIDINKTGRSGDYLRLGIPNWTGDRNALKVRRGGVGRFREARPDLADDALLARKHPLTLEVLRRAPPSS